MPGAAWWVQFPLLPLLSDVVSEISEVLTFVCTLHNLPLAQTWVAASPKAGTGHTTALRGGNSGLPAGARLSPADGEDSPGNGRQRGASWQLQGGGEGERSGAQGGGGGEGEGPQEGDEPLLLSTSDLPSCVYDPGLWGFRQACCEHRLEAGQVTQDLARRPLLLQMAGRQGSEALRPRQHKCLHDCMHGRI